MRYIIATDQTRLTLRIKPERPVFGASSSAAAARARIDYGDLTALLYIQGYRANDILSA